MEVITQFIEIISSLLGTTAVTRTRKYGQHCY